MNTQADFILASRSPRRRELLDQLGLSYTVQAADIDETPLSDEAPEDYVRRMALEKAVAVMNASRGAMPILAADTIVVKGNKILGQPVDTQEAKAMLQLLSGDSHSVLTAVALQVSPGQACRLTVNKTRVRFCALDEDWIDRYITSGEPMDKAGSYGIQGLAGQFVEYIEGSYSSVMGLPLFETAELLRDAGIATLPIDRSADV